jgi:hypothetical protein
MAGRAEAWIRPDNSYRLQWPRFGPNKLTFSRPQSVEGMGGENSGADKDKKCCNCFKHGGPHTLRQVRW